MEDNIIVNDVDNGEVFWWSDESKSIQRAPAIYLCGGEDVCINVRKGLNVDSVEFYSAMERVKKWAEDFLAVR
jgi:hypothetical protein